MNNRFKFRVWDNKKKLFLDGIPPMEYMLDHDEWDHRDCYDGDPRIFVNNVFSKDFKGRLIFQQYTGLKDKNGKEIYEGDILKVPFDLGGDVIGQVSYEADHGGYIFQWERKGPNQNYINLNCDVAFESVIVGNIYE